METELLLDACSNGDITLVRKLVEEGTDVNVLDKYSRSPLHVILTYQWDQQDSSEPINEIINLLVDRGCQVNIKDNEGETALHLAARIGNEWAVNYLLDQGAFVDCENIGKERPIHCSAQEGHENVLNLLISRGANITDNTSGTSLLLLAAATGCFKVVALLINKGLDVFGRDDMDRTLLHYSVKVGCLDTVKLLLAKGLNLDDQDAFGYTPLHLSAMKGHIDLTKLILQQGSYVDFRDIKLRTPLHLSLNHRHLETSKLLLECGADVRSADERGWTPLHYASYYGDIFCVQLVLKYHPDIDAQESEYNSTPLHLVVEKPQDNEDELLSLLTLLECNANVNLQNIQGESPLHLAIKMQKSDFVANLLNYGADITLEAYDYSNLKFSFADVVTVNSRKTPFNMVMSLYNYEGVEIHHMVVSHAFRLKALGLLSLEPISNSILNFFSVVEDNEKDFQEINLMKKTIINDRISFFDILTAPFSKLLSLCRNSHMENTFAQYKYNFPIYKSMLNAKFSRAFYAIKLYDQVSQTFFSTLQKIVPLFNYDCTLIILSFLSDKELRTLAYCFALHRNSSID